MTTPSSFSLDVYMNDSTNPLEPTFDPLGTYVLLLYRVLYIVDIVSTSPVSTFRLKLLQWAWSNLRYFYGIVCVCVCVCVCEWVSVLEWNWCTYTCCMFSLACRYHQTWWSCVASTLSWPCVSMDALLQPLPLSRSSGPHRLPEGMSCVPCVHTHTHMYAYVYMCLCTYTSVCVHVVFLTAAPCFQLTSLCLQNRMVSMSALVQFGCYHWCSSTVWAAITSALVQFGCYH